MEYTEPLEYEYKNTYIEYSYIEKLTNCTGYNHIL